MKLDLEQLKLLGLSHKEKVVLDAIWSGKDTPVLISKYAKVSRPATYEILNRFKKRGLVKTSIRNGKHYWSPAKPQDLEEALYDTKKTLFNIEEGVEEVRGISDATIIVHRGQEAVKKVIKYIMTEHRRERFFAIQGDLVTIGWDRVFGQDGINDLNKSLKRNEIISEMIMPQGFFERQVSLQGKQWAIDFEGRAAIAHYANEEYFNHAGQIWVFKGSVYLIAMHEEIIIEVRNSEIQKLILSMFHFMQDHSRKFDLNALLRDLIAKEEKKQGG